MGKKKVATKVETIIDPQCPVHGFALAKMGGRVDPGLEMIRKLETRIEMLEAQMTKKAGVSAKLTSAKLTQNDVIGARNAIFNRFREGGGAFRQKKEDQHNAGGEVACYTLGGIKRGTCRFANFKDKDENIVGKLSQLSAQFTNEKQDGCWNGYTEMLDALDSTAADFAKLVGTILKVKVKSGGICVGLPGTGSYFLGGKKLGTCSFPLSLTGERWELIKNKILELIQAIKKEKQDGCYLTLFKAEIQQTFDNAIDKFLKVWENCKPGSCPGTNTSSNAVTVKVAGKTKRTYKKKPTTKPKPKPKAKKSQK